jgi:hypothetical protein
LIIFNQSTICLLILVGSIDKSVKIDVRLDKQQYFFTEPHLVTSSLSRPIVKISWVLWFSVELYDAEVGRLSRMNGSGQ